MKQYTYVWMLLVAMVAMLSSCEVVEGVFKAGFWTAIILIVLVVGLIIWLVSRFRR